MWFVSGGGGIERESHTVAQGDLKYTAILVSLTPESYVYLCDFYYTQNNYKICIVKEWRMCLSCWGGEISKLISICKALSMNLNICYMINVTDTILQVQDEG